MGVNGRIYIEGADLTEDHARHLRDQATAWALTPDAVYVKLVHASDGSPRVMFYSGLRYNRPGLNNGCWPLIADEIAVVQAAFLDRPVYYTHDAASSVENIPAGTLVDEAFLAEQLSGWQSRRDLGPAAEDTACPHDELTWNTENIEPQFAIPNLARPAWWYACPGIDCLGCGAWVWNNPTRDDDLVVPDGALSGLRARTAMTLLLREGCATVREAFAVAEAVTL